MFSDYSPALECASQGVEYRQPLCGARRLHCVAAASAPHGARQVATAVPQRQPWGSALSRARTAISTTPTAATTPPPTISTQPVAASVRAVAMPSTSVSRPP
eukprot:gene12489-12577_t